VKLICVDLEDALPDIAPCAGGEQWVLVRLHRQPLGYVYPPREGCNPSTLARTISQRLGASIARHLVADRLGTSASFGDLSTIPRVCPQQRSEPRTAVTVAVCTRNRAMQLPACLDAITALDYPEALLDIVVVDNAPSDVRTRDVVAHYARVRYVCEPRPGLDRARNRAALDARGEIVAYTDDDVSVDRGWVRAIARAFEEEPQAACVTGLVVPDELDTPAQILFERYGGFGRGFERCVYRAHDPARVVARYGGTGRFGTGANMAFRRAFLVSAGLFDTALDVGTPAHGGGDLEMFLRVLKHGNALVYDPRATVRHRHRRTYAELRRQIGDNGVGFYAYLVRTARAYPEERGATLRLGLWWLWWWNLRRLVRAILPGRRVPLDLVVAELTGSLTGLSRYRPQEAL
jgi:glycosyltransferase involved in cell wall biosynthesis